MWKYQIHFDEIAEFLLGLKHQICIARIENTIYICHITISSW